MLEMQAYLSASHTLALIDLNQIVYMDDTAGNSTVTIPTNASVAFAVGSWSIIMNQALTNSFNTTVTGAAGVTVTCSPGCVTAGRATALKVLQTAANQWLVTVYPQFPLSPLSSLVIGNGLCAGCLGPSGNSNWTGDVGQVGTGLIFEDGLMELLDTAGNVHSAISFNYDITHSALTAALEYDEWIDAFQTQPGAVLENWVTETGNHTVNLLNDFATGYFENATSGSITLTLPAAAYATASLALTGATVQVKRIDASTTNQVTIAAGGSDTIQGNATYALLPNEAVKLQANASNEWYIIAQKRGNYGSGSIGGSALVAGQCSSGTVAIPGVTNTMQVNASPETYPGDGNPWEAYVSATGTVTVKVCAIVAGTPTASVYIVSVLH